MSVVFVVISPVAATLSQRLGQRVVSATGLFIAAGGFALFLTVTPASSFWLFLATSLILGLGIALAMTPATNAIVASLPPHKQGVASAVNDLSRELGSAFGVAIIGSAFNTGYRNSIDQHLGGLPDPVAALAHEAPATAYAAAAKLPQCRPGPGGPHQRRLHQRSARGPAHQRRGHAGRGDLRRPAGPVAAARRPSRTSSTTPSWKGSTSTWSTGPARPSPASHPAWPSPRPRRPARRRAGRGPPGR